MQVGGSAFAALAKAEVSADDDVVQAEAAVQDLVREIEGGEGGKGRVERELVEPLYAQFCEAGGAGGAAHQPEGG